MVGLLLPLTVIGLLLLWGCEPGGTGAGSGGGAGDGGDGGGGRGAIAQRGAVDLTASHLDPLLGDYRIVLLVADSAEHVSLQEQREMFRDAAVEPMAERDLVVVEAIGSATEVRQRFGIPADQPFAFLLIGKDGGVKLRRDVPVSISEVKALIDTMPMRQREMRELR